MINLKKVEDCVKKVYEGSFELSLLQQELENMLNAIDRNNMEFKKGKISRNAFKSNESKLKKKSIARLTGTQNAAWMVLAGETVDAERALALVRHSARPGPGRDRC